MRTMFLLLIALTVDVVGFLAPVSAFVVLVLIAGRMTVGVLDIARAWREREARATTRAEMQMAVAGESHSTKDNDQENNYAK